MGQIFHGASPFNDGTELTTLKEPRNSYPIPAAPERPEEFAPGLDPDMQKLADAFTEFKEKMANPKKVSIPKKRNTKK
jgi:Mn-containing catalase